MTMVLDEGDSILESIKIGMKQYGLNEVTVEGMEGKIKEGIASYMEGSRFMTKNFSNDEVFNASGKYRLQVDQLWGNIHVVLNPKAPLNVTLVKGKASDGLKIELSFIEFVDLKAEEEQQKITPPLTTTETTQTEKTFTVEELNQQLQTQ